MRELTEERKEYLRQYMREYRRKESVKARKREYISTPEYKAKKAVLEKKYQQQRKDDLLYSFKLKVRSITNHAIKAGKLKREPCENCGEVKSEAHHDDYYKPLDVRWLCKKHHQEWHKNNDITNN